MLWPTGSRLSTSLKIIIVSYSKFGPSEPPIVAANGGLLSYNVKFKVDISGRIWEELGVCWKDGATVKINGVMGLKTLEWVSDEVAADIGNYDFCIVRTRYTTNMS